MNARRLGCNLGVKIAYKKINITSGYLWMFKSVVVHKDSMNFAARTGHNIITHPRMHTFNSDLYVKCQVPVPIAHGIGRRKRYGGKVILVLETVIFQPLIR